MFDKNKQIIKFIVERLSGKLGRTQLMKLIYLADYHSHRLFGRPVSTFKYALWEYGPFDKRLYDYLQELSPNYIKEKKVYFPTYEGYLYHDGPARARYSLTEPEIYMLEYVISTYSQCDLHTLLEEVVYKTEPVVELIKKKTLGKRLNMKIVDNVDRALYEGLNPEDIIKGEKAVQEGKVVSLEEAFRALQSRNS